MHKKHMRRKWTDFSQNEIQLGFFSPTLIWILKSFLTVKTNFDFNVFPVYTCFLSKSQRRLKNKQIHPHHITCRKRGSRVQLQLSFVEGNLSYVHQQERSGFGVNPSASQNKSSIAGSSFVTTFKNIYSNLDVVHVPPLMLNRML